MLSQITIPLRTLLCLPFLILLMVGTMLPSDGQHGLLSIKSLAFIASVLSTLLYITIKQSLTWTQLKLAVFLLCSLCWLVFTSVYSHFSGTEASSIIDQFKIFLITLAVAGMTVFFVEEKLLSFPTLLKAVVYFNFAYSLFKTVLAVLLVLGLVDIFQFISWTGTRVMTYGLYGNLTRLQTSVDIITPFLLLFVLQSERIGVHLNRSFKVCYLFVSTAAILLSFSRFLIFIGFLSCILYWMTLSLPKILKRMGIVFALLLIGVGLVGGDIVVQLIEKRLYSKDNNLSDQTRVEQIEALMEDFSERPLLGKGTGGYSEKVVRDQELRHSYEVQWVAFLMQFGIIGMLFLLTPLGVIYRKLLKGPFSRTNVAFALLFTCWLLSGFTNPFLISLASGIIYALFLLTGTQLKAER